MISSSKNRWLKELRRVRRDKDDSGRLLLEGPHLLVAALDAGIEPEATLATPEFLAAASADPALRSMLARLPRPPLEVEPTVLSEWADADSPRGLVALGRREPCRLADIPLAAEGIYVYADRLQDPGNLGALARVAEAASATALATAPGSCRLEHPRALRASAGSLLRLPAVQGVGIEEFDRHLCSETGSLPRWLSLTPRGGEDLYSTDVGGCLVLTVGGEGPGLDESVLQRTDLAVTIPMAGPVESLNATVAAAVALFEIARRRRSPTH